MAELLCYRKLSFLRGGGTIFGVCYSPDFREAEYACVERIEDLERLKGSKYIPSKKRVLINGEYVSLWPLVSQKLEEGRTVLFTGLGCDVAALYSYLAAKGTDTSRLFTAELVCYGPALPEVHRQYVDGLEAKYNSRVTSFTVRHKAKGWTPLHIRAEFENGQVFITDFYQSDYGRAFGLYTRDVCYGCRFRGRNHKADVTLGDYWGLTPDMPGWNKNGVSIFIVRTEKGEELIRMIPRTEFTLREEDVSFAVEHNRMYYEPRKKPEGYAKFRRELEALGLHRAVVNHYGRLKFCALLLKERVKSAVPAPVKKVLKEILRRG